MNYRSLTVIDGGRLHETHTPRLGSIGETTLQVSRLRRRQESAEASRVQEDSYLVPETRNYINRNTTKLIAFRFTGQAISNIDMQTVVGAFGRPPFLQIFCGGTNQWLYAQLGDMVYFDGIRWSSCDYETFHDTYVAA